MENLSSNSISNSNTNFINSSNIISLLIYIIIYYIYYNYKGIPLLYSTITPGAYELNDIAELIKEETDVSVIIESDKKYNEI